MDGESQNEKDARVEKLWNSLQSGSRVKQELDLQGFRDGLRKINHPLQNAEQMLQAIMRTIDTSKDGRIQFTEFLHFVERTEEELWQMFKSIDKNGNGMLDRQELRQAFDKANISISDARLQDFFNRIDSDHDGAISFDEWRNFLLFIPTLTPNLRSILSYYSSSVAVNPEGDASVQDENIEGIGIFLSTHPLSPEVLHVIYYFRHASEWWPASLLDHTRQPLLVRSQPQTDYSNSKPGSRPWDPGDGSGTNTTTTPTKAITITMTHPQIIQDIAEAEIELDLEEGPVHEHWLTSLLPHPGYFVAGGVAGIVSRTATAPLDRLKVYLIAQTGVKEEAVKAVKSGSIIRAAGAAVNPLKNAVFELWKIGGVRSLWAGNGLNVIKVAPESAIKFGSYEGAKRLAARLEGHNDTKNLHPVSQFFAAGSGGMISQFAIYPLDTLKFRVQCETVEGGAYGNALIATTFRKMMTEGVRTFYRGLGMGLIGMFPYAAIDLTLYEYTKQWLVARKKDRTGCDEMDAAPGQMMTGAIGAISSSIGASAVYPLNLLRTRMQSQGTAIHPPTYTSWKDCFKRTVKKEGYRGLYRGLTPNLLKVVPAMSISYIMYESSKEVIGLR